MKTINEILDFAKGNESTLPAAKIVIGLLPDGTHQIEVDMVLGFYEFDLVFLDVAGLSHDVIEKFVKTDFTAEIEAAKRKEFERLKKESLKCEK